MAFQGYVRLELAREKKINGRTKSEIVKRIEKKNTITGYIDGVLNEGNYGLLVPQNKMMPIRQFCEGCILTDNANDATGNMIAYNSGITACGGNDSYAGTYMKRGSISQESSVISSPNGYKGYRFVWDWTTDRGNGVISSVCLTRHQLAISEFYNDRIPNSGAEAVETFLDTGSNAAYLVFGGLHIVDYEKEVGYRVTYSNGVISIAEYQLSTKRLHLLTRPLLYTSGADYTPEYVTTHQISQTLTYFADGTSSISYTGDKIIIVTWSDSNIKAYPIDTSTWTVGTVAEKTFSGVSFMNYGATYSSKSHKDIVLIDGNYAWVFALVSNVAKLLKIDLLGNTVDVAVEKTIPSAVITRDSAQSNNGCFVLMPNGDFYKFCALGNMNLSPYSSQPVLYYHNGELSIGRVEGFNIENNGFPMAGGNANAYGTQLFNFANIDWGSGALKLTTMHGFVSTIANLDEAVTKAADLTMKLTYEITEVAS